VQKAADRDAGHEVCLAELSAHVSLAIPKSASRVIVWRGRGKNAGPIAFRRAFLCLDFGLAFVNAKWPALLAAIRYFAIAQ
jgi:hypothetical protein